MEKLAIAIFISFSCNVVEIMMTKYRPTVPVLLWKFLAPTYSKLVTNVADGMTFEETQAMRNKGLTALRLEAIQLLHLLAKHSTSKQ